MRASVVPRVLSEVRRIFRGEKVVLAVSGGIDSMVLLDAAAEVAGERVSVATFDHGTGPDATRAADLVVRRSSILGLQCDRGSSPVSARSEAELRALRWTFLNNVAGSAGTIATAHTADDQIETVLMRTLRGAGARGLAALAAPSNVLRPLLGVRRDAIVAYARTRGIEWIEDPSNTSMQFFRNRIRHELLPALRNVSPSIDDDLFDVGGRAARWRRDVDQFIDEYLDVRVFQSPAGLDVSAAAIQRYSVFELRELLPAIVARAGAVLDRRGIVRLAEFARNSRVGARVQISGAWEVTRSRDVLQLRAAGGEWPTPSALQLSQSTTWAAWRFSPIRTERVDDLWVASLPSDRSITVRAWRPGDVMVAGARARRRKVKELLTRAGITGYDRAGWPVVIAGDDIVWIPGVRRSEIAADSAGRPGLSFVCEYLNR
jgi:tRNA(Ile)-lysidine synthase